MGKSWNQHWIEVNEKLEKKKPIIVKNDKEEEKTK